MMSMTDIVMLQEMIADANPPPRDGNYKYIDSVFQTEVLALLKGIKQLQTDILASEISIEEGHAVVPVQLMDRYCLMVDCLLGTLFRQYGSRINEGGK